jgi:hypothetical protein
MNSNSTQTQIRIVNSAFSNLISLNISAMDLGSRLSDSNSGHSSQDSIKYNSISVKELISVRAQLEKDNSKLQSQLARTLNLETELEGIQAKNHILHLELEDANQQDNSQGGLYLANQKIQGRESHIRRFVKQAASSNSRRVFVSRGGDSEQP